MLEGDSTGFGYGLDVGGEGEVNLTVSLGPQEALEQKCYLQVDGQIHRRKDQTDWGGGDVMGAGKPGSLGTKWVLH